LEDLESESTSDDETFSEEASREVRVTDGVFLDVGGGAHDSSEASLVCSVKDGVDADDEGVVPPQTKVRVVV